MDALEILELDVKKKLFHKRNDSISSYTKDFWINCFGIVYTQNIRIEELHLCHEKVDIKFKKYKIKFKNFYAENCAGEGETIFIERAAICINLITIPFFYKYEKVQVIQYGGRADYIFYNKNNFTLESKGVNHKYNCSTKIKDAEKQTNDSFIIFKAKNIMYGISGVSCFYKNEHYLIKIDNNIGIKREIPDMDNLEELIQRKSQLISKANTLKEQGFYDSAKESFAEALLIEEEIAVKLDKRGLNDAKIHWISAISCAKESEKFKTMYDLIDKFMEKHELSIEEKSFLNNIKITSETLIMSQMKNIVSPELESRIIKYLLYETEEKFGGIRGKGNIIKMDYHIRGSLYKFGKITEAIYVTAKNPIHNKEISKKIQNYIDNKYLVKNSESLFVLAPRVREKLKKDKAMTERILINKFSKSFIIEIDEIIKKFGDKTSKEMEELEKEENGISSSRYSQHLR